MANQAEAERGFPEIDLRRMMDTATDYRRSRREGRWVIQTHHQGRRWEVVIEPAPEKQRLIVVTAYEAGQD